MKKLVILILITLFVYPSNSFSLPDKTGTLNEPFFEWEIEWDGAKVNPYDVIAHARFRHIQSGEQKVSLMFYDENNTWKFRFTGTRLGEWKVITDGPGNLDSQTASIIIQENPNKRKGFLKAEGTRWVWDGTNEEHIPQLVMSESLSPYWTGSNVNTQMIDKEIQEFIIETGFTGFHKPNIACEWFDINNQSGDTRTIGEEGTPDPKSFQVAEEFLVRAYTVGASTHFWLWGADSHHAGWGGRHGPDGIGGPKSPAAKRLYRYIAARLGPIPGWSMGYGFDLEVWADAEELQWWYDFMKTHLHQWNHLIGARADEKDTWDREKDPDGDGYKGVSYHNEMVEGEKNIFWWGDYIGMYDYRVPYRWYVKTLEFGAERNKPVLQEDRFRIRNSKGWFVKDYTPDLTRRGLWHSMMAGGVGNIWGNLLPDDDASGSQPYDNKALGSIQNVENFQVNIKHQIQAWREFWFVDGRFRVDYQRANEWTNNQEGVLIWDTSPSGDYISVALRSPDNKQVIFYRENADSIRMDLREMAGAQPAVALNTKTGDTIKLSTLEPKLYKSLKLDITSDWAIAVGKFESN